MSEIFNLSTICRCCHSDGNFKSLREPCRVGEDIEIYESMLRDVFAIAIFQITTATFEASYTVCDHCIDKLRDAVLFKQQVLECEKRFYVYYKNEQFLIPPVGTVKVEKTVNGHEEQLNVGDSNIECEDERGVELKSVGDSNIECEDEREVELKSDGDSNIECEDEKEGHSKYEHKVQADVQNEVSSDAIDYLEEDQDGELWEELAIEKDVNPKNNERVTNKQVTDEEATKATKGISQKGIPKGSHILIQINWNGKRTTYTCKTCLAQFENKDTIKKHIFADHKDVSSYECGTCFNVFFTKKALSAHRRSHRRSTSKLNNGNTHKDGKPIRKPRHYPCEICKKSFSGRWRLKKHMRWHDGTNKTHLCELCGRGFNDSTNLRTHIATVHEKLRPYVCDMCSLTFTAKKYVKAHILAHMYGPQITTPLKCDKCAKQFKYKKSLQRHQLIHDNKYSCRVCNRIFDSFDLYKTHRHVSLVKIFCNICNKEFSCAYNLKQHMNRHNNIREFSCDQCPLSFSDKAQLKKHIRRLHDPDNPNKWTQCTVCKRLVKDMAKHLPKHDRRKYSCMYCPRAYVENRSLNRHIEAMHSGEVEMCDVCFKSVISYKSLVRHKMRVHKIYKSETGARREQ